MKQCMYYNKKSYFNIRIKLFSSWTYDRLLSNASIEKKDLSLIGFITGILCIISILCSFILRILIYFYSKISKSFIQSSSISKVK